MRLTTTPRRMALPLLAALAAAALHTLPATGAGASPASPAAATAPAQVPPGAATVASGLDNPRGLAFAPDGVLYVAESGRGGAGPCLAGPEGDEVCFGATGAITRVRNGEQERILDGLPSLAAPDGSAATGPSDVDARHGVAFTVGLGADPTRRADLPAEALGLGWLERARPSEAVPFADVAGYEGSANPDGVVPPDSNPNSVVMTRTGWYVVDAGGNSLLHVDPVGRVSTVAVFPARPVPAPPFLELPPGAEVPMDAVPTSVVQGPDGALYVGQLTGFPFPDGGASVWRVVPGQEPTVFASGFTNVVDLDFDERGRLYVLEVDRDGLLTPDFAGQLVRVGADGGQQVVAGEGLVAPNGLAIRGKAAYVTNCGTCAGDGAVLRIPLPND